MLDFTIMFLSYSYEGEQAQLLIKALDHYRTRLARKPLTPDEPQHSIGLAYGIFTEPASKRYISRLLTETRRNFSDFGAINLYFVEGTSELSTQDFGKLANYTVAVYTYLIDLCFEVNPAKVSMDQLIHLRNELAVALREQFQKRQGDVIDSFVYRSNYEIDPEDPTTYVYRFRMALSLLCGNHLPDIRLCERWLDENNDDAHIALQEWAVSHSVMPWATGIGVIEAALSLADTPDEGGDHEDRGDAIKRLFPEPKA